MIKNIRQEKLYELVSLSEGMTISEMAEKLNVSKMTIRRDLSSLEERGLIKAMHGGAIVNRDNNEQPSFRDRFVEFSEEKNRIAEAAADLIKPHNVVFFDPGTTVYSIIKYIPRECEFTAISSCIMTLLALCKLPNASVISIGGEVHKQTLSAVNQVPLQTVPNYHADLAFISTKAVSIPDGTYEAYMPLIEVKKAIIASSEKAILLVDHSKFNTKSLSFSFPLYDFDLIITDDKISKETHNALRQENPNILMV